MINLSELLRTLAREKEYIFTNLLTNAVKYSDAGRMVQFEIVCVRSDIICTIRDQGIGIPEADPERLFNAFHRGRNVGERPGTGLGLVIVKRCVDLHGGEIKVDSKPGEDTSVTLRRPESDGRTCLGKPIVKRSKSVMGTRTRILSVESGIQK